MIGAPHTDGPEPLRTDRLPPSSSWAAAPANGTNTLPYERSRLMPECASPSSAHSHCDSHKPPARTGASRRPRAAWRKPPARTGASCGQPPTRSFGSPQGEKVAKPHIDLRHRLRIHDSGDVDDPFARYGPRLLGHGVRRTTQNKLRPPQQNVIRPTAADRRCRDDDCKRIGLLETEVPGGRRGPGGVPPARGRASGPTRPTRPRLCKGRQPCHASLEATSQARNSSQ